MRGCVIFWRGQRTTETRGVLRGPRGPKKKSILICQGGSSDQLPAQVCPRANAGDMNKNIERSTTILFVVTDI